MTWLLWALGAAAVWGAINVVDKIVVEKYVSKPEVYLLFGGLASVLPAAFVLLVLGLEPMSYALIGLSLLTGVALISYTYFFFASLTKADAPIIVALFQIVPVFSAIWGLMFFGETFSAVTYVAMGMVIMGAIGVSIERKPGPGWSRKARVSSALGLMLVSTFLASTGYALQKYVLQYAGVKELFFWGRVGDVLCAGVLLTIPKVRHAFVDTARRMFKFMLSANLTIEVCNSVAIVLLMMAYATGPLSLVATCAGTQPFFVLLFVRGLNAIWKEAVPDSGDKSLDKIRIPCMLLIAAGIYLLSR